MTLKSLHIRLKRLSASSPDKPFLCTDDVWGLRLMRADRRHFVPGIARRPRPSLYQWPTYDHACRADIVAQVFGFNLTAAISQLATIPELNQTLQHFSTSAGIDAIRDAAGNLSAAVRCEPAAGAGRPQSDERGEQDASTWHGSLHCQSRVMIVRSHQVWIVVFSRNALLRCMILIVMA